MQLMRRPLTVLLLMICCLSAEGQRRNDKVLNRPYADNRAWHLGFGVGVQTLDLAFTHNGFTAPDGSTWFMEQPSFSPGFNVNFLIDFRLSNYFNLRLSPGMYFGNREVKMVDTTLGGEDGQNIKSTFVALPVDLRFSAIRYGNVKPYLTAGAMAVADVAKKRDDYLRLKTFDAYLKAKQSFFDLLPSSAFALTNIDDKVGEVMVQNTRARRYTYSLRTQADFTCRIIESRLDGTLLSLNGHEVHTLFTGRFNAYNLTAVYGACLLVGLDPEKTLIDMSRLVPVAGRFQTFHSPSGAVTGIVDYAHTPDAVVNVITAIRDVVGTRGNIITVVGAGGNRDKGKRPIMAAEAARLSDRVVLTSDNPRDEVPEEIIRDMEAGLTDETRPRTLSIADRREAIRTAIALAAPGDVVLVAGKGHEDYQEIHGVKHHFDDREVIAEALAAVK